MLSAAADAHALVESKCITPRGQLRGAVEFLPDAQADRRRPCRGFQTEYKTEIVSIKPHSRAMALGLVPRSSAVETVSFRYALPYKGDVIMVAKTDILSLSIFCGENPVRGPGGEAMVVFEPQTLWGHGIQQGEAASAAGDRNFLWWDDHAGDDGQPGASAWRLLIDDESGDDTFAVLPIPETVITNGTETIALRDGTVTLNGPEADCLATGTVEVVE